MHYRLCICTALLLVGTSVPGQVGVNTSTPEQTLDVNGKIRLGNDATAPSPGTLRFDSRGADFQGYDGNEWKSLTVSPLERSPRVALYGYSSPISVGNVGTVIFRPWENGTALTTPPVGKMIVVTAILPRPNALGPNKAMHYTIGPGTSAGYPSNARSILMLANSSDIRPIIADNQPLFVILPGEYLRVTNEQTSQIILNMNVRAFLVDALEY